MSGPQHRSNPAGFEIPDLDLPLPSPGKSQSGLRAVAPSISSGRAPEPKGRSGGAVAELDFGEPLATGPALDLDVSGPISASALPHQYSAGPNFDNGGLDLDGELRPALAPIAVAAQGRADWPTGVTPDRVRMLLDPLEIRLLADFGEPSGFGPLNIRYAVRVALRRQRMKSELKVIDDQLTAGERERDGRLAELATALLPTLQSDETYRRLLQPLAEIDALSAERSTTLARVEAEGDAERARIDGELTASREELSSLRTQASAIAATLAERTRLRERLEAREKRCHIEIRAIETLALQRLGPQGGQMPAELAQRLLPLQTELRALTADLTEARQSEVEPTAQSAALQRRSNELEGHLSKLERSARDAKAKLDKQLGARGEGLDDVQERRRAALADIGRAVLAARGAVPAPNAELERVREAEQPLTALVKRSELFLRALDAVDHEKVRSGALWLASMVLAVLGYVVYRLGFAA